MAVEKVFIADDHGIVRDGLKKILADYEKFEVIGEAENGQETIQKVIQNPPDILILDISMPIFNGFQVVERLKDLMNDMKVIILTAQNNESHIAWFLRAGVQGYIIKSAVEKEFILALEAISKGGCYLDPSISRFVIKYFLERIEEDKIAEWDGLTNRELEVLKLIAEGYKNQDIATLLNVSIKTIESHRYNIMDKLDMHDRIELVKYAIRTGIIQL
ncbi:MAG: response regulator transcription factor [Halanaerobiales bacterium]|nr:response regulator transcription factor [Halanaerobiales bacterium]